jgi:hypothetical protein
MPAEEARTNVLIYIIILKKYNLVSFAISLHLRITHGKLIAFSGSGMNF